MSKVKYYILVLLGGLLLMSNRGFSQRDLSFYHLGAHTPHSNMFNASYFPDANVFISLPIISGVQINYHNGLKYSDLFTPVPGTDSVELNSQNAISKLKDGMKVGADGFVSLFQLGIKLNDKMNASIFWNARFVAETNYPNDLLKYFITGNGNFLGETVSEADLRIFGMAYREVGASFTYETKVMGDKPLRLGTRLKVLRGMYYGATDPGFRVNMLTDANDLSMNIRFDNATFRSAGFELEDGADMATYLTSNNNRGFSADLGAEWMINEKWSVALGINDIGSITWKEGVKTSALTNSEVNLDGFDLRNIRKIDEIFQDYADVWFDYETNTNSFKTRLPVRTVASGSYKLRPKTTITASMLHDSELGFQGMAYGAGIAQDLGGILRVSATLSRTTYQEFAFGGAAALRFAGFQLYAGVDNINSLIAASGAEEFNNLNVRFGLNLLYGRPSKNRRRDKENSKFRQGQGGIEPFEVEEEQKKKSKKKS